MSEKIVTVEVAQQQIFSRSDAATIKRAFQDLNKKTTILQNEIMRLAATEKDCSVENFKEAWENRKKLNELNTQFSSLEKDLSSYLPKPSTARLSTREKQEIKGLYQAGLYTQSQLAEQYNIRQSSVSDIIKNQDKK